jgi:hypothetical protein
MAKAIGMNIAHTLRDLLGDATHATGRGDNLDDATNELGAYQMEKKKT